MTVLSLHQMNQRASGVALPKFGWERRTFMKILQAEFMYHASLTPWLPPLSQQVFLVSPLTWCSLTFFKARSAWDRDVPGHTIECIPGSVREIKEKWGRDVLHSGNDATNMASVMSYQECMWYCLYSGCEGTDSGCDVSCVVCMLPYILDVLSYIEVVMS